jgi:hypothetical protein
MPNTKKSHEDTRPAGEAQNDSDIESELDSQLAMELESEEHKTLVALKADAEEGAEEPQDEELSDDTEDTFPEAADEDLDSVEFENYSEDTLEEDVQRSEGSKSHASSEEDSEAGEPKKIQIEFPYSQLIREKVPKVFEVAESVAEQWVNDGDFENVPVGHPLAQITVAAGLRKAKEVEKKLEEKGVFAMAKMGLEYAKSQLNEKLKKK